MIQPWEPKTQKEMVGQFCRVIRSEGKHASELPGLTEVWTRDEVYEAVKEFFAAYRVVPRKSKEDTEEIQFDLFEE